MVDEGLVVLHVHTGAQVLEGELGAELGMDVVPAEGRAALGRFVESPSVGFDVAVDRVVQGHVGGRPQPQWPGVEGLVVQGEGMRDAEDLARLRFVDEVLLGPVDPEARQVDVVGDVVGQVWVQKVPGPRDRPGLEHRGNGSVRSRYRFPFTETLLGVELLNGITMVMVFPGIRVVRNFKVLWETFL